MTLVEELANFVVRSSYEDISAEARRELKIRVLDSLGCAIGALEGRPLAILREQIKDFGGNPLSTLIAGGQTAPDRAAFYNSALVRYLDYNDTFIAKGESCHPSDNLGAVLAASEYADRNGKDLLTALAVAYQVQCRLSEVAPVRAKGFDHTVEGTYAVAAGVSRALGLDAQRTANAIAISGTAYNALRVTRTGSISHWKGMAYPAVAHAGTHATFLAMRGMTGPIEVFEGNKGFMESIAGRFTIDWSRENLEIVRRTSIKKYNAEFHSQPTLEGILQLREQHQLRADQIERIEIDTFDVAYHIIGGGEEGDKRIVRTKEEADHSLHYMVAVALLDGKVTPEQYRPERIAASDVQTLLRKVEVRPADDLSARFPAEMPCRIRVLLTDGRRYELEIADYPGFYSRPLSWEQALEKFESLAAPYTDDELRRAIAETVQHLDEVPVRQLTALLARVRLPAAGGPAL
ncbi:MAG: MmgE/PrpD family protein [Thermogemmatispora sp.]|uniref:MmgE/PrpD family protein n=1 Tax=Thermogemmatispora sp. TaxID=1968838 RepID=UPI002622392A|nr:MmgE/PrpD family protein [Thermogemmatispora sp.]MBX5458740.1 MmgE/PrpD family protein [Thermogemmatispora sp.]